MQKPLSNSEYLRWWNMPAGVEVKAALEIMMNEITEEVMSGKWLMNPEQSHYETGKYQAIKQLLDLSYEQLMGEKDE